MGSCRLAGWGTITRCWITPTYLWMLHGILLGGRKGTRWDFFHPVWGHTWSGWGWIFLEETTAGG